MPCKKLSLPTRSNKDVGSVRGCTNDGGCDGGGGNGGSDIQSKPAVIPTKREKVNGKRLGRGGSGED